MINKKYRKYFGTLRIPTPPTGYPNTTKSGEKGYDRKNNKRELDIALGEEEYKEEGSCCGACNAGDYCEKDDENKT